VKDWFVFQFFQFLPAPRGGGFRDPDSDPAKDSQAHTPIMSAGPRVSHPALKAITMAAKTAAPARRIQWVGFITACYTHSMDSRRHFLGKFATGIAGTLAAVPSQVLGANERIRVGFIGFGDRATELFNWIKLCPNTEVVAFCDIYTKQLERAKSLVPDAATYLDYHRLLEDQTIDAVVIATPQHLHAEHFCAALGAGKHVYQEKTMAFSVNHAKKMRAAFQKDGGKHTVQIGHQSCSSGHMLDAQQWLSDGQRLGKITAIDMRMYRNTPHGKPQWSRTARITQDMNSENILWKSFQGDAPPHEFDANRYMNWRYFFDYSGGNIYEKHVPSDELLVQGAEATGSQGRDDEWRHLPVERRA